MNLGLPEIGMLLIMGVIMFGPEKVPPLARKAAKIVHFLRGVANDAQEQLRSELGPEYADLELRDLHPKVFVQKHLLGTMQQELDGIKEDLEDIKDDLAAEGKDLAQIESALSRTDSALATADTAAGLTDGLDLPTPWDTEAT